MMGAHMPCILNFQDRPVIDHNVRVSGPEEIFLGKRTHLYPYCYLKSCPGTITIGDYSGIGEFTYINSMQSVTIGRDVLIAPSCHITDANHSTSELTVVSKNPRVSKPVIIKDGSWVGAGAKNLPGVTIGIGAVVGGGSVVTRDIPDYAIAVGVPCKVIKY